MSVYTPVSEAELTEFLSHYDLGALTSFEGISAGIENTNYFVDTEQGRYVLTLFEQHGYDEMPYFLDLMAFLAEHDVPSPHPLADKSGAYLRELNGRPTALVQRLEGRDLKVPEASHCAAVGKVLGRLHRESSNFTQERENDRGPKWWRYAADQVMERLSEKDAVILKEELRFQSLYRFTDLPRGTIHADLFRDNALFNGDELAGLIDFYYACHDVFLYDIAVTVNDWCSNDDGTLDRQRMQSFLDAYHQERPLTAIERGAWPVMMRAAALRFWLSRLMDQHFPRAGEITHIKDPEQFKTILLARRADEIQLQLNWVA